MNKIDTPKWWRARCRVALDDVLVAGERWAPKRIRKELRRAPRALRQPGAPAHRARIWWQVVRRVLGPEWANAPDRRQLLLF